MSDTTPTIQNRYDFVLLFDVLDGNPNGDPDAGNLPRIDPETGHGLVTDVCLKRKIRNRVQLTQKEEDGRQKFGYDIFIQEKAILNNVMVATGTEHPDPADPSQILPELGTPDSAKGDAKAKGVQDRTARMCKTFFDIRTFGAVLTTKPKAKNRLDYTGGQVRGPIQFTFARSVDPIVTLEHSITRMAVATEEEAEKQSGDNRTMGRKNTVPYGLYKAHGFIVPSFAARTGFSEEDLKVFWDAVKMMFVDDPSAARGTMTVRKLIVFKHDSALGNAQAAELFERVTVKRKDPAKPARAYVDYTVSVDKADLPAGIEVEELL